MVSIYNIVWLYTFSPATYSACIDTIPPPPPPPPPPGLVTGFVNLPTYMLAESTEVLWTLMEYSREVKYLDGFIKKNFGMSNESQVQDFITVTAQLCRQNSSSVLS